MKENSLLKINGRHINQVICNSVVCKEQNTTKQSFKSRDSQNALLLKLSGHIPNFLDNDVFPFGGSDFTVSKWAFGKVALLEIDHMKVVVTFLNDLPVDVVWNIVIYADDTTLYSKCDQASDLWQQLELVSEIESDLRNTVEWSRKWIFELEKLN